MAAYKEICDRFEDEVLPHVRETEISQGGMCDPIMRREAWNDWIDGLHKDGEISDQQCATWTAPAVCHRRGQVLR